MNSYFDEDQFVKEIDSSEFNENYPSLLNYDNCSVILFYAPWCPYCKAVKDTYSELGVKLQGRIKILSYNSEKNKEHFQIIKEETPNLVTSFPTLIMYKNGQPIEKIGINEEDRLLSKLLDDSIRLCYQEIV